MNKLFRSTKNTLHPEQNGTTYLLSDTLETYWREKNYMHRKILNAM